MKQYGVVIAVDEKKATLQIPRSSACGDKCGSCSGQCSQTQIQVEVENTLHAGIGDRVEVESAAKTILGAAFLVYILPLIMLFIGIFISNAVMNAIGRGVSEPVSIFVGGAFLALTFLGIRISERRKNKRESQIFTMTRLV